LSFNFNVEFKDTEDKLEKCFT